MSVTSMSVSYLKLLFALHNSLNIIRLGEFSSENSEFHDVLFINCSTNKSTHYRYAFSSNRFVINRALFKEHNLKTNLYTNYPIKIFTVFSLLRISSAYCIKIETQISRPKWVIVSSLNILESSN